MTLLFFALLGIEPPTEGSYDPAHFSVHALHRIESPTSLLFHGKELLIGADTSENRPGIYRLIVGQQNRLSTVLVHYLPQQDVVGLHSNPQTDTITVASARYFTAFPEDWVNQVITVNHSNRTMEARTPLPLDIYCGSGKPECGAEALFPVGPNQILAVTRKQPTNLVMLEKDDKGWTRRYSTPILWQNRVPQITEAKIIGDHIYFLFLDLKVIARGPLSMALGGGRRDFKTTTVLDLAPLHRALRVKDSTLGFRGCFVGFDVSPEGDLYLLAAPKGNKWERSPDDDLAPTPKLIIFPGAGQPMAPVSTKERIEQ